MTRPFLTHPISDDSALGGTTIQKSLRFNRTDTPYLQATLGDGNEDKWTWSAWVKKTINGQHQNLFSSGSSSVYTHINFDNNDRIRFQNWHSGQRGTKITTRRIRDNSSWMHIVIIWDSGNSTADDRMRIYVNGTRETAFDDSSNPNQNQDSVINGNSLGGSTYGNGKHLIGRFADTSDHSGSYKAEINFVDGYAYDPSYFGYTDFQTKLWRPKKYEGTHGSNGFYLNFLNNDTFTNFTDTSSSARTITRNGNVIHKSDQTKNGATSIYFDGSGDSLTVPDSSDFHVAGNDFTIEAYIRRTSQGSDEWFFVQSEGTTSNTSIGLHIGSSSSGYANKPSLRYTVGGSGNELTGTTALAANTWYHIAAVRNGNTLRIYVNGVQENSTSFSGTITDASTPVIMGAVNSAGSAGLTGHMDQIRWSNSCRYPDGTSFTAPTAQFTADSNTKLLVQSNVTKTLGSDSSGNGNDFTPNNFSVSAGTGNDSLEDTPTNNFCTLNPLDKTNSASLREGALSLYTDSNDQAATGTFAVDSGKWYWEVDMTDAEPEIGIAHHNMPLSNDSTSSPTAGQISFIVAGADGNSNFLRVDGNTQSGTGLSAQSGPGTIGIALDMDNKKIWFTNTSGSYFNSGNPAMGVNAAVDFSSTGPNYPTCAVTPIVCMYQGSGKTTSINFGQRPFSYSAPTGFKTLCSNNLPPTVPSINAQKHFDTLIYTGDGSSSNQVTGLEFKPDMVWIKGRSGGTSHVIQDVVRGNFILYPDSSQQEGATGGGWVKSFNSDGFITDANGPINTNNATYVAWCWKAGGAAVSNSDGSVTSSISANQEAGFSIVSWTGSGADASLGHGLGKKPKVLFVKNRDASDNWKVWFKGVTTDDSYSFQLDTSGANYSGSDKWYNSPNGNDTTTTTFGVSGDGATNRSGEAMIAYCWAEIPGFSKYGVYTGNGSTNGTFVHTGFSPRFIIYKKVAAENWHMFDTKRQPKNPNATVIDPNRDAAETTDTNTQIDILSNGFKFRTSHSTANASSTSYLYMAWAEFTREGPYDTETNAR